LDRGGTLKTGEKIQKILGRAESPNHIVLAELPGDEVGGFSLARGEQDGLTSLLILFFINYPELFISTVAVMTRIFVDAGQGMAGVLAGRNDCTCPKCTELREGAEGKDGESKLEDFTAKGKYKH
jgi:hypothetical protein